MCGAPLKDRGAHELILRVCASSEREDAIHVLKTLWVEVSEASMRPAAVSMVCAGRYPHKLVDADVPQRLECDIRREALVSSGAIFVIDAVHGAQVEAFWAAKRPLHGQRLDVPKAARIDDLVARLAKVNVASSVEELLPMLAQLLNLLACPRRQLGRLPLRNRVRKGEALRFLWDMEQILHFLCEGDRTDRRQLARRR